MNTCLERRVVARIAGSSGIVRRIPASCGNEPRAFVRQTRKAGCGVKCLAMLTTDLVVAMAILVAVMIPLCHGLVQQHVLYRAYYYRAAAMELVDGEMEVLAAGSWRQLSEGSTDYQIQTRVARNLPPGRFVVTRTPEVIRLEWIPEARHAGGRISREISIQ